MSKLFQMPINLTKAETDEYWEIEGLASSEDKDLQDEIVRQDGFDLSELKKRKLVFNDNHSKETSDILGLVDYARITDEGLYVKGKLFKNKPAAVTYANLMKHGGYVGFSVEGTVKKRDALNKNVIKEAKVIAIALTRHPVNEETYASMLKSLTCEIAPSDATQASLPIESEGSASLPSDSLFFDIEKDKLTRLIQIAADLTKGKKVAVGTISGKYRKVGEGKWAPIKVGQTRTLKQDFHTDSGHKIPQGTKGKITHIKDDEEMAGGQAIHMEFDSGHKEKFEPEEIHEMTKSFDEYIAQENQDIIKPTNETNPQAANTDTLEKMLAPGGAQYTGAPDTITGGSTMMTEDLVGQKKKKAKKKKRLIKATKMEVREAIFELLKKNPKPNDEAIHDLAEDLDMDASKLEEAVYSLLGNIGQHKDSKDSEFDKKELEAGIKVEAEHTQCQLVAKEIAKDHLKEIPDYYTRLKAMEEAAKKSFMAKAEQTYQAYSRLYKGLSKEQVLEKVKQYLMSESQRKYTKKIG